MRRGSQRLGAAGIACLLCLVGALAQAQPTPDPDPQTPVATLTFHGRTAAIGAGFTWGASTLEFQGQSYPVRIDAFVVGSIGTSSIDGVGQVYGLGKAEDLNGNFTAVSTGLVVGRGKGSLVMRNDKGVRIVIDATGSGLLAGLSTQGLTLEVGEAGGPPADASARLPQTLGFGEIAAGPIFLRPTFNAQIFFDAMGNAGFDGEWSFGPVDEVNHYFEHSNEIGMNARYPLGAEGEYGTLLGRVSGLFSLTASGPDGPVCNGSQGTAHEYTLESAYLAWKSGNLFSQLGENFIELSGGNQNYQVFDGLLFWDGGQDCTGRGGNWVSGRKAFRETGLLRLNWKNFTVDGVHLKYHDQPNTHTRLGAARIEWVSDETFLQHLKVGGMYFNVYESDTETRDGMNGVYLYTEINPLRVLPDLSTKGSFVWESNPDSSALSNAYGWYVAAAYAFSKLPWTPELSYRYASFSGGTNNAFDSLFTGLPDWGYWFQGELLGEFVLSNSNLNSHQARLKLKPHEILTFNLIYYKFLLDDQDQGFGVVPSRVNHRLADEFDFILDVALTNWWSITTTFSVAVPNKGFRDAVDGSATWVNGYVYMNFNF